MKKISKKIVSAEYIARQAEKGKDISHHFTNKGKMMAGIQRVNVDFTEPMLAELDSVVKELNISRQAVIKTFIRQALNQHYHARNAQNQER